MAEEPTSTPAANQPNSAPAPANTPAPEPAGNKPDDTPAGGATPPAGQDEPLISLGDGNQDAEPKGDGQPDGGKPDDGGKPEGAPDSYSDFTLPDGFQWDDGRKNEATALFKELNLPQAQAQKLVDAYCKAALDQKNAEEARVMNERKQWRNEVMARPDFREQQALATKGMRMVVKTPEQQNLFRGTWLQDCPAIFDMFVSIGKLVAEDTMRVGAPPAPRKTEGQINMERFPNL